MSFESGLSGLNAASKNLDAIGNNVANANTVGFKSGMVQFADVYANSLNNSGGSKLGIGTRVAGVAQQFTQGNISTTSDPLDIAINGNGFSG
jgi:flagellar hook protein FlgE